MKYRSLFAPESQVIADHPLARRNDPQTSKDAAESFRIGHAQEVMLRVFKKRPNELLTANEAGKFAHEIDASHQPHEYRKRAGELCRKKLIKEVGEKVCPITGKTVTAFRYMSEGWIDT